MTIREENVSNTEDGTVIDDYKVQNVTCVWGSTFQLGVILPLRKHLALSEVILGCRN